MREVEFKRFGHKATCPKRAVCLAGYDLFSSEKVEIPARSVNSEMHVDRYRNANR